MSKANKSKRQYTVRAADINTSCGVIEQDKKKYGAILFQITYDVDVDITKNAAPLYGSPHSSDVAIVMVGVGILGLAMTLAMGVHNLVLLIASLIIAVSGSTATRNWENVQAWALMGTNLGASEDDVRRHVVVTPEQIIIEGPGAETTCYDLHKIKRVRHNANGCLVSFGRGKVAYFPASKMSVDRLRELEHFLEEKKVQ